MVAHGALRQILARYLRRAPEALELEEEVGGKPYLRLHTGEIELRFSLSHSHDRALVAVVIGREVGVDIERVDPAREVAKLADRFFAEEERRELQGLLPSAREQLFFRFWTLKEAYLKALGEGLRLPLGDFAVAPPQGALSRLLHTSRGAPGDWSLRALPVEGDFAAALAARGEIDKIVRMRWRCNHAG